MGVGVGVGTRGSGRLGEFECGEEFDEGRRDSLVVDGGDAERYQDSDVVAGILA